MIQKKTKRKRRRTKASRMPQTVLSRIAFHLGVSEKKAKTYVDILGVFTEEDFYREYYTHTGFPADITVREYIERCFKEKGAKIYKFHYGFIVKKLLGYHVYLHTKIRYDRTDRKRNKRNDRIKAKIEMLVVKCINGIYT